MFRNEKCTHICELRFRSVEFAWWHIDNERDSNQKHLYTSNWIWLLIFFVAIKGVRVGNLFRFVAGCQTR